MSSDSTPRRATARALVLKASPPRRRRLGPASILLLPLLLVGAAAGPPPLRRITSSALLVLDPDPNDPCFASSQRRRQACVEPCASVLRVDLMSFGLDALTASGPDYTLKCETGFKSEDPGYRTDEGPRGTVTVSCPAMTIQGYAAVWPPAEAGSPKPAVAQKPALVFDFYECRGFGATGLDGKPYGKDGTVCQSVFDRPDARVTSAVFDRRAYFDALCHPWHCPPSGCGNELKPQLVLTAAQPGSGRVQVMSVGICSDQRANCTRVLGSATYKILEGRLFNETARPPAGDEPKPCPVGTCPRKIFVPYVTAPWVWTGDFEGLTPGPRENVCVPACDGGGKANATAKAIEYASAPLDPLASPCPTEDHTNKHFACRPACLGWERRCCALNSIPGPSADCPACPPGTRIDRDKPTESARLRLASVVAPNATVPCGDFVALADTDVARGGDYNYFAQYQREHLDACPPRELVLAMTAGCEVRLSAASGPCSSIDRGPVGGLNSLTRILDPQKDGAAAVARRIRDDLITALWESHWRLSDDGDQFGHSIGNLTVLAIEPGGAGGRGLLALKLQPFGCIYRYAVVEGALPGARAPVAAAAGAPLPAATRWCPGGTTKAAKPAELAEPGEPVPLCVMNQ